MLTFETHHFWDRVQAEPNGCWLWTGNLRGRGGYAEWHGHAAHRLVCTLFHGPIPAGYEVDHVWKAGCQHRNCVNPLHLEAVTPEENARRATEANRADPLKIAHRRNAARKNQRTMFLRGFLHRLLHGKPTEAGHKMCYRAGFSAAASYRYDGRPWREHAEEAWARHCAESLTPVA